MPWKFNDGAPRPWNICDTPRSQCVSCLDHLYFARKKPKKKHKKIVKGHVIGSKKRFLIYKHLDIIIGPNQALCGKCNSKPVHELNIASTNAQTTHIPDFLYNILSENRTELNNTRQKQSPQNRDAKNAPISLQKLNDEQIRHSCGLDIDSLNRIVQHVNQPDYMHYRTNKLNVHDLFIACCIWRQNLCYTFAATLFGYKHNSGICKLVSRVINLLSEYWVEDWIGSSYWTEEKLAPHIPQFVKDLYPEKNVIGVVDATYLYMQKSRNNYQYQKASYSAYKHRNLQKEHVLCTPDGKVVFVDGPYYADGQNNDDKIWDSIVHSEHHDINIIYPDGKEYTVVADRGYRSCHESDKFKLLIPNGVTTERTESVGSDGTVKVKKTKKVLTEKEGAETKLSVS